MFLRVVLAVLAAALGLGAAGCGGSGTSAGTVADGPSTAGRSSGELDRADATSALNANANADADADPGSESARSSSVPGSGRSGSIIDSDPDPESGGRSDAGAAVRGGPGDPAGGDANVGGADTPGPGPDTTASGGEEPVLGAGNPGDEGFGGEPDSEEPGSGSFLPPVRDDGIELVFADGALGPARLGSSIDEIAGALGPLYTITAEASIRSDFPSGYSIANGGEVLFWAIEEDGLITLFMSSNPKVGLDSGLRPKLTLAEAVAMHSDPTFSIGPAGREFVAFADGVGGGTVSVLVAIGEFGGPVGVYDEPGGPPIGAETVAFQPENANIKELWFWAESPRGSEPAHES